MRTMAAVWNGLVCRAWYAADCPPNFPLRRIEADPMAGRKLAAGILVAGLVVVTLFTVTPPASAQPYGGCKEAWQAPRSAGADDCRRAGWTVRGRLVVSPRGWVRFNRLPHCRTEDSSGGRPCTWNIGPGIDGNGIGRAYWLDRKDRPHYVKGIR